MWPLLPALPLLVLGSEFAILNEENDKNSSEKLDKGLKWEETSVLAQFVGAEMYCAL